MTTELPEPIVRIELDGFTTVGSGARTTNVFVVRGERPALIGCGHAANVTQLLEALHQQGIAASDVDRIIAGSWSADAIGGHAAFPRAQLFVTSPDLTQPRAWNSWSDRRRARYLGVADEVLERKAAWERADVDAWLAAMFPRLSNHLDFVPLRAGHTVAAGELELEVIAAPGPNAGHALLWSDELSCCFAHDFVLDGLPPFTESARDYVVSLERALQLEPEWLLCGHGAEARGQWTLKRLIRFCTNYLSNAPVMLTDAKTVLDVVDADLGHVPDHPALYVEEVWRHRPFLDELVAARVVVAEGEGLDRIYKAG